MITSMVPFSTSFFLRGFTFLVHYPLKVKPLRNKACVNEVLKKD